MSEVHQVIALNLPAARRGDRDAFAALVAATQSTVTSLALAVVRDVQHSEDIAQEAYLAVWRKIGTLRNPDSFLPWLRQVTRNLARDHLRRGRARPGDQPGPGDDAERLERFGPGAESSEQAALEAERDRLIAEALEALPDDSREVLTLYYREGQSGRQVAELLGLSEAAVRQRLSRARASLREEVGRRFGDALVRTVPGAAFTGLVASLLVSASPPAAAAMSIGLGAKSGLKLLAGPWIGVVAGLVGGIAGVMLGLRPWIRTSTDPEELAALKRLRAAGIITVTGFVFALTASLWLPGWLPPTVVLVLFITAIGWQTLVLQPRILEKRLADRRRADPAEIRLQRRQRRLAWLGLIAGTLMGGGGLLAGLLMTGRIGF